jgi:MoxR-like ATPase
MTNKYGHREGIGSRIDALLEGGADRAVFRAQGISLPRLNKHILHLLSRHGVNVDYLDGIYRIRVEVRIERIVENNSGSCSHVATLLAPPVDESMDDLPGKGTTKGYIKPSIYNKVKKAVVAGMTPVVFGPAGSGKSRLAKEVAKDLGKEFHTLSFSGGLRYSQVFGSQTLKDSNTEWTPAPLLNWVQTACMILLDEIFSADPEVLLGLNSILEADTRSISTPIGVIKVHPECLFIAAANSNGRQQSRQYTGAVRSDDSLLDRLIPPFYMDYDERVEEKIAKRMVDEMTATHLVGTLQRFRKLVKENGVPFDPSTRRLIGACKLVNAGFETAEAFRMSFMETLSQAEAAKVSPFLNTSN